VLWRDFEQLCPLAISLGAIQKVLDRVAQAIAPHYTAMAMQVRHAVVHSIDETPWFLTHMLQWLWGMVKAMVHKPCAFLHRL
jgi:hypothetical protein